MVRAVHADEFDRLVAQASAVFRPGAPPDQMARDYPLLFDRDHMSRLRIAVDVDHPGASQRMVAHAGYALFEARLGAFDRQALVACVGAVFSQRPGAGLGAAVLADALANARAEGAQLAMVSGSGPLYQRQGFVPLAAAWSCRASRTALASAPPVNVNAKVTVNANLAVSRAEASYAVSRQLRELADRETTAWIRSTQDWVRLLKARLIHWRRGSVWIIRRDGAVAAYACMQDEPKTSVGHHRVFQVLEVGGDRGALADAAPVLACTLGADELQVLASARDIPLLRAANTRGWAIESVDTGFCGLSWSKDLSIDALPPYGLNYV